MKGWAKEHLEKVADRNSYLFKENEQYFRNRMRILGWSKTEIEDMVKYLKRRLKRCEDTPANTVKQEHTT